jgi:hypothetical protein
MGNVRIPQLVDIREAIRIYYTKRELRNADIKSLFGEIGAARVVKLKDLARDVMRESNVPALDDMAVNTDCAFEAWGIDITTLEKNYAKLKRLGI